MLLSSSLLTDVKEAFVARDDKCGQQSRDQMREWLLYLCLLTASAASLTCFIFSQMSMDEFNNECSRLQTLWKTKRVFSDVQVIDFRYVQVHYTSKQDLGISIRKKFYPVKPVDFQDLLGIIREACMGECEFSDATITHSNAHGFTVSETSFLYKWETQDRLWRYPPVWGPMDKKNSLRSGDQIEVKKVI